MTDPTQTDGPHVAQAAMDEDIRQAAIDGSISIIEWNCMHCAVGLFNTANLWPSATKTRRARVDRALRVLRHFGLLVEHGDGVVSIMDQS